MALFMNRGRIIRRGNGIAEAPTTYEYEPVSFSNTPTTYEYEPVSFSNTPTTHEYEPTSFDDYPSAAIPISDTFDGTGDNSGSFNDGKWFPRWNWDTQTGTTYSIVVGSGKVTLSANGGFNEVVINPITFADFDTDLEAILTYENLVLPADGWEFFFRVVTESGGIDYAEGAMINDAGTQKWKTDIGGTTNSGADPSTSGSIKITRTTNGSNDDWAVTINGAQRATASTPVGDPITNFVWGFGSIGTGTASIDVTDISVKDGVGGNQINVDGS